MNSKLLDGIDTQFDNNIFEATRNSDNATQSKQLETTGYRQWTATPRLPDNTQTELTPLPLADPRGGARDPPRGSKFFHFHAVFGKKN